MIFFLVLRMAGHLPPAWGTPCPAAIHLVQEYRALDLRPTPIVEVGPAERRTLEAYSHENNLKPKVTESRYAPSGDMVCDGASASGQVTVARKVVTTAAHLFSDEFCNKTHDAKSCVFILTWGGRDHRYPVKKLVESGWKCPKTDDRLLGEDWAVVELTAPVDKRVTPLPIPATIGRALEPPKKVTLVAKSSDWPAGDYATFHDRPRHYGNCEIQMSMQWGTHGYYESDCDTSYGASGGALLTPGDYPVLIGTVVGSSHGPVEPQCAAYTNGRRHGDYKPFCWAGWFSAVTGFYEEAILKAAGLAPATQPVPHSAPAPSPGGGFKLPKVKM